MTFPRLVCHGDFYGCVADCQKEWEKGIHAYANCVDRCFKEYCVVV